MDEENPQDISQRTGLVMLILFWVAVLALGSYFAQGYLQARHNPNAQPAGSVNADGLREVVLQRNAYGHYVSSGKINGVDVTFFLDTGASNISIPAHIAERIGLKRGYRYRSSTANGTIDVYSTELDSVQLGNITLHNLPGSINPHYQEDEILLGMSFLKHLSFTQQGKQLILRQ
ncbi:MAG: TIGR02281 family clan AA aspartic protease [Gammaproteobacteria bacterium]|nr:MAG: TIGR02281 family clan AA aspartic protease [Gammaproteobacteria bacterium]